MISAFAALAGVIFAAIQTFGTSGGAPVNVTVAVDPATLPKPAAADLVIAKTQDADDVNVTGKADGGLAVPIKPGADGKEIDLLAGARFLPASKDSSSERYAYRDMFDDRPDTSVTITEPDSEINVIVDFATQSAIPLSEISYTPAPGSPGIAAATNLDVMVLPEGEIGANGGQVLSYTLQTEPGKQTFLLPPGSRGKGLWLRIAGSGSGIGKLAVGDFRILTQ